jgi:twitching motility protein PilT
MAVDIAQLLAFAVKNKASDLHLSSGVPPMIRVDGDMKRINMPSLTHKEVHSMVYDIMNDKQRKAYEEFYETDFSFEIPKLARFRVNAFNQNRGAAAVFRNIPSVVLSLDDLNAPEDLQGHRDAAARPRAGHRALPGSGKSTTLAAMINYVNDNRPDHIITIEDPIEFVHESKRCLMNQREVHRDTLGFSEALRSALREDPDVILVGEMRDWRRSAWRSPAPRRATWCSARCTRVRPPRPSTASSTCSRRPRRRWCARCCPNRCARSSRRRC